MFALATSLVGLISFLLWLHVMGYNRTSRSHLLVGLLVVIGASFITGAVELFSFGTIRDNQLLSELLEFALLTALVEEGAKSLGIRNLERSRDRFALVSLFGIYELMLSKPLAMFDAEQWIDILPAFPALAMHTLTATIYAYRFPSRPVLQFAACFALHAVYNGMVTVVAMEDYFEIAVSVALVVFTGLIGWLGPWFRKPRKPN